jgi:hypothetical protein
VIAVHCSGIHIYNGDGGRREEVREGWRREKGGGRR